MSANAIETLRHARGDALAPAHRDALAAVEALLEAAKVVTRHTTAPRRELDALEALAIAVRLVETGQ